MTAGNGNGDGDDALNSGGGVSSSGRLSVGFSAPFSTEACASRRDNDEGPAVGDELALVRIGNRWEFEGCVS